MRTEVLTSDSAFRTLQPEWLRLLGEMSFQSVFFTPQWQEAWWRHFGAGRQLSIITVRSEDGRLQGLAPLMRSGNGAEGAVWNLLATSSCAIISMCSWPLRGKKRSRGHLRTVSCRKPMMTWKSASTTFPPIRLRFHFYRTACQEKDCS